MNAQFPAGTTTRSVAASAPDRPIGLGIVIPTLNAAASLRATLRALAVPTPGLSVDIVVVDGGSGDETLDIAQRFGARIAVAEGGRGPQLAEGARVALGDWLFFLHADTVPPGEWPALIRDFTTAPGARGRAGYFRFTLDDERNPAARRLERFVAWRSRFLGLPYGDQGLLVARMAYEEAGGFPPVPLMEDVALVRRIGRRRLVALDGAAMTSAARYRREGYLRRGTRNLLCLGLHFCGVPAWLIHRIYG
ncbi:TIGR04283 family arsenosugar biosynthesis glycosyltransferase [Marivibrio halodurans]|uniref:TIGR04283 family arsenosugar biosynthesis glycosyltransferase n=1 Tax=Marivibrio halodurans TaxID=2039722 RepID=A0A8J7S1Z0_9PROT|nr:TIGR04283 family arsenosugar biosynthesis glycosyltransferase [Marivibrio halodurans]MBP5858857.1 TIGR04283 family arsenosugar biosynthesis glycosyltransferase [Marivibrio halodurans]